MAILHYNVETKMAAKVKKVTEGYSRSYKLGRKAKRLQSKSTKLLQNICLFVRLFFDKEGFFSSLQFLKYRSLLSVTKRISLKQRNYILFSCLLALLYYLKKIVV